MHLNAFDRDGSVCHEQHGGPWCAGHGAFASLGNILWPHACEAVPALHHESFDDASVHQDAHVKVRFARIDVDGYRVPSVCVGDADRYSAAACAVLRMALRRFESEQPEKTQTKWWRRLLPVRTWPLDIIDTLRIGLPRWQQTGLQAQEFL